VPRARIARFLEIGGGTAISRDARPGQVIGFGVVEVNPPHDPHGMGARTAGWFMFELARRIAESRRQTSWLAQQLCRARRTLLDSGRECRTGLQRRTGAETGYFRGAALYGNTPPAASGRSFFLSHCA
jgi:hypothetical protein